MSAERFIRCKHCGLPHEAGTLTCPMTGRDLPREPRRSLPPTSASPAVYQWAHSVHGSESGLAIAEGAEPDVSALVGRTIDGKYRVDELIGRGGMGAVYRAENTRLGKQVAIKVLLRAQVRGSEAERRFNREARIAGSIGHPNIVEVFDLGTLESGAPFQVMELLHGQSLASRLRLEGALPIDEMLDYAEQVLSALGAAHQAGVIHRDLKPDNIFLEQREETTIAKLLDFGISKSLDAEQTLAITRTGMILGTPFYLAPEQAIGDPAIDHRIDIWAMGVVLYEALTGTLPFKGDNYNALVSKIIASEPAPPSKIRPALGPIEHVILKALATEPKQRFESAAAMRNAIRLARGIRSESQERASFPSLLRGSRASAPHDSRERDPLHTVDPPSIAVEPQEATMNVELSDMVDEDPDNEPTLVTAAPDFGGGEKGRPPRRS